MSSIIRDGDTYHGISVFGRGVFTGADNYGRIATYAGQCKDGHACGLGVLTYSNGAKDYAEHGPDGQCDGRCLDRNADGDTYYGLFERGETKDCAIVYADGSYCMYNYVACAPDDPRLLALIAHVAPVEVRPAAAAPHSPIARHSTPSHRPINQPALFAPAGAGDRRGHRGAPPTPHAAVGGCAIQPNNSRTAPRDHAVTRARTGSPSLLRGWRKLTCSPSL